MIELTMPQGSQEWINARLGIPTASSVGKILTPGKLAPSAQASSYLCDKLAERLLGFPMDAAASGAMVRGSTMEHQAVAWYEFQHDTTTRTSGICLTDDRRFGASVDRFVGEHGILEVKCPLAPKHLATLLGYDADAHRLQVQAQMWVTGRAWVDLLSYFDGLPYGLMRVERDEEAIAAIADAVAGFCDRLDAAEREMRARMGAQVAA